MFRPGQGSGTKPWTRNAGFKHQGKVHAQYPEPNECQELRQDLQVVNQGNVPCDHKSPCSPDGKWKATSSTVSLDAGPDNTYANITASCIAGRCPFTRIDSSGFIHGGRKITMTALNWSDRATFLMEAEVYHTAISAEVRELYPVIFGQTLNFTLPPTQEGVSLRPTSTARPWYFLLGPNPSLSWATCTVRNSLEAEEATVLPL